MACRLPGSSAGAGPGRIPLALAVAWLMGCGGGLAPNPAAGDAGPGGRSGDGSAEDGRTKVDATTMTDGSLGGDGDNGADGPNSGGGDTSVPCNGGQCPSPADVSGFQPMWIPPTGAHQGVCTTALISEFYQDCLAAGGSCGDFTGGDAAHQACASCLQTQYADAKWGPLVYGTDNIVETNLGGCIALLEPSAQACAQSVEAADECEHAACDPVCNAGDNASFDLWDTCAAAANTCGCQSWFQASQCVKAIAADGGAGAGCLIGQTFEDYYYVVAPLFCGN